MSITVTALTRTFRYNGMTLPDADPTMTVEQVKAAYAVAYPELVSAAIEGPTEKDGVLTYEFRRGVGTKG